MQTRTAVVAVGPSTVRGLKLPGVVKSARDFLKAIPLKSFATTNARSFSTSLDEYTVKMQVALPKGARFWGVARKCLNIFLRDAFYNHYLREHFGLDRSEHHYEIPLDSIVAKRLWQEGLPRWEGVKYVTPELNSDYQRAASAIAAKKRIERVHLDTYLWTYRDES
jgi:hypothetical protein